MFVTNPFFDRSSLLKLGRQAEPMKQAEDQDHDLGVRLEPQKPAEPVHIVESFVDHRKPDDRIDDIRVGMHPA